MTPCVYTTQFSTWLEPALARAVTDLICFRSGKRWATAAKLLGHFGTLLRVKPRGRTTARY